MIRIGRCQCYSNPSYPNFTSISCIAASVEYGSLSPFKLKDSDDRIFENIYQASKIYESVPAINTDMWSHDKEKHYDSKNDKILPKYWIWRKKLEDNKSAVRYPVGYQNRRKCLFSIKDNGDGTYTYPLDYIGSRKKIYVPGYIKLVMKTKKFRELKKRLEKKENLLLIDYDGPHSESLEYYKDKYDVNDSFIKDGTMKATIKNLNIMLNDTKHPFGHAYCLAIALLYDFNKGTVCKMDSSDSD